MTDLLTNLRKVARDERRRALLAALTGDRRAQFTYAIERAVTALFVRSVIHGNNGRLDVDAAADRVVAVYDRLQRLRKEHPCLTH